MQTVTLIDGTIVANDSEAWRHETEARAVLAMPTRSHRIRYMEGWTDPNTGRIVKGVLQHRGQPAADELKAKVLQIWQLNQNQ
jgi:hypothetical protein